MVGQEPVGYHAAVHPPDVEPRRSPRLPDLVNADAGLVRRGQRLTTTFLLAVGDTEYLVHVASRALGRRRARARSSCARGASRVRASADAWARFWRALPEPGYHDLFAMKKLGVARVEGDLWPLMAHLRYVKDVLAAPRRARATG